MGFGWLFLGYFMAFMMSFSNFSHGIILLGCALMINGLHKLKAYNRLFVYPIYPLIPYLAVEAIFTAKLAAELFGAPLAFITDGVSVAFELIGYVLCTAFHILMLRAVAKIALDVGLEKQKNAAMRNRAFTCVYYAVAFVWAFPIGLTPAVKQTITVFLLLVRLAFALLNCVLLYSCYALICPQGDEDMPIRELGIGFIDDFRRKTAEKQQKAADERVRRYQDARFGRALNRQLNQNKKSSGRGKKKINK